MPSKSKLSRSVCLFVAGFFFLFILTRISSIPVQFVFLEIGKITGPIPGLIILLLIPAIFLFFSIRYLDKKQKLNRNIFSLVTSKKGLKLISICIFMYLALTLLFSIICLPLVIQKREKIVDPFIQQNNEQNLTENVANIKVFLNHNLKSSYKVDQSLLEIDMQLFITILDPQLLNLWNISRADIIVYQGWGSCGQAAILLEELLQKLGYETRQAKFIGIDHGWAEVKNGSQWLIVDPWYIGNLVPIQQLKTFNTDFEKASGVKVLYRNGTILDVSTDHGY